MGVLLLAVGVIVAAFVGYNIGGSSTGVAFGPAVGSKVVTKLSAAVLMSVFALAGGLTVGRRVIDTMGGQIVPSSEFTLAASIGVLFFVGLALLVSNRYGVPASTSMTAVGSIAGLGAATDTLQMATMGKIVSAWLVAPLVAFWVCAVIGRDAYPYMDAAFSLDAAEGALLDWRAVGPLAYPVGVSGNATTKQFVASTLVVAIGCYMAFSAGASNAANAVAPLVGSGSLDATVGVLLAGGAIALGAFTIARRTLDTVGNGLTELPLLAALVVETVSASLITSLSALGIPASLAVSATMCIVGLGWGRATRSVRANDVLTSWREASVSVNALGTERADTPGEVPEIGEENPAELDAADLFDPDAVGRVVVLWVLTPSVAAAASFALFSLVTAVTA